mmetsp:Transcript_1738/g.3706  ORF Transcript_1738/g.3706 Transcript_1738/m.3706 type:complete len:204 (-) Transcript_1738:978-1589(-)
MIWWECLFLKRRWRWRPPLLLLLLSSAALSVLLGVGGAGVSLASFSPNKGDTVSFLYSLSGGGMGRRSAAAEGGERSRCQKRLMRAWASCLMSPNGSHVTSLYGCPRHLTRYHTSSSSRSSSHHSRSNDPPDAGCPGPSCSPRPASPPLLLLGAALLFFLPFPFLSTVAVAVVACCCLPLLPSVGLRGLSLPKARACNGRHGG